MGALKGSQTGRAIILFLFWVQGGPGGAPEGLRRGQTSFGEAEGRLEGFLGPPGPPRPPKQNIYSFVLRTLSFTRETKPHHSIWFDDIHGPKPCEFTKPRTTMISHTPVS